MQDLLNVKGRIFDKKTVILIALEAVFMCFISLMAFLCGKPFGSESSVSATMVFATLGLMQIFHSYNVKTDISLLKADFKSNAFMNASAVLTAFIIIFLCVTPAGGLFSLATLTIGELLICVLLAFTIIPFCEIVKLLVNKTIE